MRRAESVDAQANRRTPGHGVFHKFHLFPVIRIKKRTRSLEPLLGHNFLVGFHAELRAHRAIRPYNPHHFGLGLIS